MVREQNRLGVLEVSAAGHHRGRVRVGLRDECTDQRVQLAGDCAAVVAQVEPDQRGNLVVATAARAQFAAELRTRLRHERGLERTVHVLVLGTGRERAVGEPRLDGVKGGEHPRQFVVGEVAGRGERRRVRPRTGEVVGRQLPVEVGRAAESLQFGRGAAAEARAPQRALVGSAAHEPAPEPPVERSSNHTSRAFWACRRFSLSSQMTLCGPSITSAVTS